MAYERVHSEATSNARRAREGGRRREREGEEERKTAPPPPDNPRTLDAREKWSFQAALKAIFFDPIIRHYSIGELDRQCLDSLLLDIEREQEKHAHFSVFLGNIAVFPYLGAVGIIQFSHRVAEGAAHPIGVAAA